MQCTQERKKNMYFLHKYFYTIVISGGLKMSTLKFYNMWKGLNEFDCVRKSLIVIISIKGTYNCPYRHVVDIEHPLRCLRYFFI